MYQDMAEVYDLITSDKSYMDEVQFLVQQLPRQVRHRPRILELGCGTGNHLQALLKLGCDVVGIDKAPRMLAIAKTKCPNAVRLIPVHFSDLSTVDFPYEFEAVFCYGTAMMYLSSYAEVAQVVAHARKLLTRNGVFSFDLWKWYPCQGGTEVEFHPSNVTRKQIVRATEWTVHRSSLHSQDCFIVPDGKDWQVVFDLHKLRLFSITSITNVIRKLGFDVCVFDGFAGDHFSERANRAVFVCTKKSIGS